MLKTRFWGRMRTDKIFSTFYTLIFLYYYKLDKHVPQFWFVNYFFQPMKSHRSHYFTVFYQVQKVKNSRFEEPFKKSSNKTKMMNASLTPIQVQSAFNVQNPGEIVSLLDIKFYNHRHLSQKWTICDFWPLEFHTFKKAKV